jgi:hypothetical protein
LVLDDERRYLDDGVSGSTLVRPVRMRRGPAVSRSARRRVFVLAR